MAQEGERAEPRPRITVSVEPSEGPPIDMEAWARIVRGDIAGSSMPKTVARTAPDER